MNQDTKNRLAHYSRVLKRTPGHLPSISQFHYSWLITIRAVGFSPISTNKSLKSTDKFKTYKFKFQLLSLVTFHSIFCTLLYTTFLGYFVHQILLTDALQTLLEEYDALMSGAFATYMESRNISVIYDGSITVSYFYGMDQLSQLCIQAVAVIGPFTGVHYAFSSLRATPYLVKFLRGVNKFEKLSRRLLPDVTRVSLVHLVRFRVSIILFNTFIVLAFLFSQPQLLYHLLIYSPFESTLLLGGSVLTSILMVAIFDDTKGLFILKMAEEHFQQINDGVALYEDKMRRGECRQVGLEEVRKWRTLVLLARKLVKVACKAVEGTILATLMGVNLVITTAIYLSYSSSFKNSPKFIQYYSYGSMIFCGIMYLRLYMKARLADNIVKKESQLANTLRQLEVNPTDTKFTNAGTSPKAIRLELSFIADTIASRPSICMLSNLVPLKVSSLFGVFQAIFTYAVALIQFDNVMVGEQ